MDLCQPLDVTNTRDKFDIEANVHGGGFSGQTGAVRLGITRALLEYDKNTDPTSETSFRKIFLFYSRKPPSKTPAPAEIHKPLLVIKNLLGS